MAALGIMEEGGEGATFLLFLGRCIEGRKRVLMLTSLALRRLHRQASSYVRLGEVLLSRRHRSPRCFSVAAIGVGAGGSMLVRQPSRCRGNR
jgi:hypothetical protein